MRSRTQEKSVHRFFSGWILPSLALPPGEPCPIRGRSVPYIPIESCYRLPPTSQDFDRDFVYMPARSTSSRMLFEGYPASAVRRVRKAIWHFERLSWRPATGTSPAGRSSKQRVQKKRQSLPSS